MFDERDIRGTEPRAVDGRDGDNADDVIAAYNEASLAGELLSAYVYAMVSTNSRDATAQAAMSELTSLSARLSPLLSRLAEWVALARGRLVGRGQRRRSRARRATAAARRARPAPDDRGR
ncbi:MAG: hypothetical protein WKF58_19775 [Ilumatobacteraceae bacterium]